MVAATASTRCRTAVTPSTRPHERVVPRRATAQAARLLNHPEDAEKLTRRATEAVRQSFDAQTGLMRPKSRTGRFSMRFDETRWGDGYTEGSPWHHSFPPFDVELLSRLHGSKEKLRDKILAMTRVPSTFDHGGACVGVFTRRWRLETLLTRRLRPDDS